MTLASDRDYSQTGLTIREAMVDHAERNPDKGSRKPYIRWGDLRIQTSDAISVPSEGVVRAEFIASAGPLRQGFDMEVEGGFQLAGGQQVPLLRTWREKGRSDTVQYPFRSRSGQLYVWNVYEMVYPSGEKIVEKWTENAGFWIETINERARVYHCSQGMATPPDFDSLVFKVFVLL